MGETRVVDVERRVDVDPETDPPFPGWVPVHSSEATYATHTLVDDVDGAALGVSTVRETTRAVRWVPPDSPRLRRLAWEREHGITYPSDEREQQ